MTKVFGEDLQVVLNREGGEVPRVLQRCMDYVGQKGTSDTIHIPALRDEGIFRLSGSTSEIQEFKKAFDAGWPFLTN